jgi:hypothetical protein
MLDEGQAKRGNQETSEVLSVLTDFANTIGSEWNWKYLIYHKMEGIQQSFVGFFFF